MPGSFETSTSYFCAWGTDVQLSRSRVRVGQSIAVTRRLRRRRVRPVVFERAGGRPGAVRRCADGPDAPVVRVVRQHRRHRGPAVERHEVGDRRRERARARELELVLDGSGHATPGEHGATGAAGTVTRRAQRRCGQGAVAGCSGHGGNCDDGARDDQRAEMSNQTRNFGAPSGRGERLRAVLAPFSQHRTAPRARPSPVLGTPTQRAGHAVCGPGPWREWIADQGHRDGADAVTEVVDLDRVGPVRRDLERCGRSVRREGRVLDRAAERVQTPGRSGR